MIPYCIVYPHPLYNLGLVSLMEKFKPGQTACIRTGLYPKECLLKITDWIGELIFIGVFSKGNDEIKLVEAIKKKSKKSRILLISTPEYSEVTRKCFIKGANGLVYVQSSEDLFLDALTRIISNEVVMPHGFRIHPDLNQMVANQRAAGRLDFHLTFREKEILALICKGLNNRTISEQLFISDQTVAVHRKNLFRKMGVKNSISLMQAAREKRLIPML